MIKLVQYHFVPYIFVYEAKLEIQFNNHQVPPSLILHNYRSYLFWLPLVHLLLAVF